jgi:rubrerythrin
MPSKKSVAQAEFEADVLARIIKLEDANTALRRDASSFSLTTSTRLTSLEDTDVHERLASLETSGDAVKYMWESMPNMMSEVRKAHSELSREVTNIIEAINEIKTQERHMEREEQRAFDEERLLAVNAVKDTVVQAQRQIQEVSSMLTDATRTLLPPPANADVCKHCGFHWWEDKRCPNRGYSEPHERFPRDDRRRTKQRCYKCDEVWEPIRYAFTVEGRRYYRGIS